MALPDYTTQDPATYKTNIDSTLANGVPRKVYYPVVDLAALSSTDADFVVPAAAKKVTINIIDASTSAAAAGQLNFRLGIGGTEDATGNYEYYIQVLGTTFTGYLGGPGSLNGYITELLGSGGLNVWNGEIIFEHVTGNKWIWHVSVNDSSASRGWIGHGWKDMSGIVDLIRIYSGSAYDSGYMHAYWED